MASSKFNLDDAETLNGAPPNPPIQEAPLGKSRAFYLSFAAVMVSTFLSALDLTAIGTALPTIADALDDTKGDYIWVGSAYALSSTALVPMSGSLADAFGRRPIMLISIAFFAVGSALAGASQNMNMMIAARGIHSRFISLSLLAKISSHCPGIGGGGILNLSEILVADLVPLAERGLYQGLVGFIWSFASCIGWCFGKQGSQGVEISVLCVVFLALCYMTFTDSLVLNLPLTAIAFILVFWFLSVRHPEGSVRSKLAQVDWTGNAMVVVGSGLAIIGMTWGGIRYPWASAQVLAPLIIGFALLVVFAVYETKVPKRPTIPLDVIGQRTSLGALLTTASHAVVSIAVAYYMPVFFQASFGASPLRSAVDFLPTALITAPFGFVGGASISILQKYRAVNGIGWIFTVVGFGLFSTLKEDSSVGKWVGYQAVTAIGTGILYTAPIFPLLAPLPDNRAASGLALFTFTRAFFQTWGITISSTILQNMLEKKLPAAFVAQFPPGFEIAYAAIPAIKQLEEPLKKQVQAAFADSMAVIWQVMIGIAGLGFLLTLLMAEVPMSKSVDENYALKEKEPVPDAERL
ncbi:MFS domain-containing protein [Mycena sanguinolenta]|uniref:MFS domain-containing protein n=1 Tax=Mycena sanguinolenta TaxID=230812 RepID=A0A8H6X6E8_9AGAR|nr:MFS domain-containing protein [Mycena sanguinolenta]